MIKRQGERQKDRETEADGKRQTECENRQKNIAIKGRK